MTEEIAELIKLLSREHQLPDRDLDARLHCVIHPERTCHPKLPPGYTMVPTGKPERDAQQAQIRFITNRRGPAPHYTRLIDEALLLVPRVPEAEVFTGMWDWQLEQTNGALTISARVGPDERTRSFADSPAIALCLASLKVRAGGAG